MLYHVLNRANGRARIFRTSRDYRAFEEVILEARQRVEMRILAYIVMPNHWHFILWPHNDGDLTEFVGWLSLTHTQRLHAFRGTTGSGHVYQGRFKSFPIQVDSHFLSVCRYIERNPLRAGAVERAEDWRWGSLWRRENGTTEEEELLSAWPVVLPTRWPSLVNTPQTDAEVAALRRCIRRGRPYGSAEWVQRTAKELGLELTLRPRGRPRRDAEGQ